MSLLFGRPSIYKYLIGFDVSSVSVAVGKLKDSALFHLYEIEGFMKTKTLKLLDFHVKVLTGQTTTSLLGSKRGVRVKLCYETCPLFKLSPVHLISKPP